MKAPMLQAFSVGGQVEVRVAADDRKFSCVFRRPGEPVQRVDFDSQYNSINLEMIGDVFFKLATTCWGGSTKRAMGAVFDEVTSMADIEPKEAIRKALDCLTRANRAQNSYNEYALVREALQGFIPK